MMLVPPQLMRAPGLRLRWSWIDILAVFSSFAFKVLQKVLLPLFFLHESLPLASLSEIPVVCVRKEAIASGLPSAR